MHDATTNPDQLQAWWDRWPQANIGLRTEVAFDVIDVDGPAGRRSPERFLAEHGGGVPIGGPRVRTGSGGWHLYVAPSGLPDPSGTTVVAHEPAQATLRRCRNDPWRGLGSCPGRR